MRTVRTLVLVGSGEFTSSMIPIDRYLLSKIKNKNIAIFPTAAGLENDYDKWIDQGEIHFSKLGAKPLGLHVVKRKDTDNKDVFTKVTRSSIVYFSGGEPSYLHEVLDETKLWKQILSLYKSSVFLAGSSAGAVVMGAYTLQNAQSVFFQDAPVVWKKTFRLIDFTIFPHFDFVVREKIDVMKRVMKLAPKAVQKRWIGIDEDTAMILENERHARVMGLGRVHVFKNGKERIYKPEDTFSL